MTFGFCCGTPVVAVGLKERVVMSKLRALGRLRHVNVVLVVTGLAATAVLALSVTGTLSGFTASINNTANSVASGTLLLQENQGATTCLSSGNTIGTNAGTCATINKYGGGTNAVPGVAASSTVSLKNIGTSSAATFTLTAGACAAAANAATSPYAGTDTAGFCGKVDVTIEDDTVVGTPTCVVPVAAAACAAPAATNTLATLAAGPALGLTTLAAGATRTYKFTVMIDNSATNADQGLQASQSLTWLVST